MIGPVLEKIVENNQFSLQIDSEVEKNSKKVSKNVSNVKQCVSSIIANLNEESIRLLPDSIRATFAFIQAKVFGRSKGKELSVLLIVLFLRMITRALEDPVEWQILDNDLSLLAERNVSHLINVLSVCFLFFFPLSTIFKLAYFAQKR